MRSRTTYGVALPLACLAALGGCSDAGSGEPDGPASPPVTGGTSSAPSPSPSGSAPVPAPSTGTAWTSELIEQAVRDAGMRTKGTVPDLDAVAEPVSLGHGVTAGAEWTKAGFPDGGVPATVRTARDIGLVTGTGRTAWVDVVVTRVPGGVPAAARPCDLPWSMPGSLPGDSCDRRPDLDGVRRMDRAFPSNVTLWAWNDQALLEVAFRSKKAGPNVAAELRVDADERDRVLAGLLPLLTADLDG